MFSLAAAIFITPMILPLGSIVGGMVALRIFRSLLHS